MRKPKGRLTDVFNLPDEQSGKPRTVLMLDRLTHVPETGDVLTVANQNLTIVEVDGRRFRNCLTGRKMSRRGSIAVLVNEPSGPLRSLAQGPDRPVVTWISKDELPWHFQTDDLPTFNHLNETWNAHPSDVSLKIEQNGQTLLAHIRPNPYAYREYENIHSITVCFLGCARYRVTPVNDHGWYGGQCRFSGLAPSWGEFYEVSGDTRDAMDPTPWVEMEGSGTRHFHFYLRDEALEVKAQGWSLDAKS